MYEYVYEDLVNQPENTIRLLTVYPGTSNLIKSSLSNALLTEPLRFKALSYVWGTEDPDKVICVDGKVFRVRPNLWTFLKRLQRSKKATVIWIDAISVNQADIPERNQQVRLMTQIYSNAEVVLAWLGDDPHGEASVLKQHAGSLWSTRRTQLRSQFLKGTKRQVRKAWDCLLMNAYWTRAWIVQEFTLANKLHIMFGTAGCITRQRFQKSCRNHPALRFLIGVGSNQAYLLFNRTFVFAAARHLDLDQLIKSYCYVECAEPRDRLYALLGLARDRSRLDIVVDYSIPIE
jgi:hypothetical protein